MSVCAGCPTEIPTPGIAVFQTGFDRKDMRTRPTPGCVTTLYWYWSNDVIRFKPDNCLYDDHSQLKRRRFGMAADKVCAQATSSV